MTSSMDFNQSFASQGSKHEVSQFSDAPPQPDRESTSEGVPPKERLTSDPNSRNAVTGIRTEIVVKDGGAKKVGTSTDNSSQEADAKAEQATNDNQRTTAGASGNEFTPQGILGCIATLPAAQAGAIQRARGPDGCADCSTIDCLADLLFGNILSFLNKDTLCRFQNAYSKSVKNQINATTNALMRAAQEAASAQALIAGIQDLRNFLNTLDPGLLAQCFGAERLKDWINGQFETAQNAIRGYEQGKNRAISDAFNSASETAQQIGNLGSGLCD